MDGANSTEFDPETPYPVIDLLPEQKEVRDMGGTMRLGADPVKLHDDTRAREIYDEAVIYERHRHRYEVNNHLRKRLEHAGLVFSGTSPDDRLVEVIELPDHPFFVASQYHPEFKSRPLRPQPLFREFVGSALELARDRAPEVEPDVRAESHGLPQAVGAVSACARPPSAAPPERERLVADFVRLCEIASPSQSERAVADAVAAELRELGLEVEEDESGAHTGSDAGNLLARIEGPEGARTILLCAHLDTVPLAAPVNVVAGGRRAAQRATRRSSAPTTRRRWPRSWPPPGGWWPRAPRVGVELLFTTCEERALRRRQGGGHRPACSSEYGFVFDHASPIGELVVASPTYYRLEARFRGHAAHAGIRPEAGRNAIAAAARAIAAMPLGRLDPETTANVGLIEGGTAVERGGRALHRRARGAQPRRRARRRGRAEHGRRRHRGRGATPSATWRPRSSASSAATGCRAPRRPWRSRPAALAGLRLRARRTSRPAAAATPTCSIAAGLPVVNVANGTERNHQPDESVTVEALERMLDVTLAIVAAAPGSGRGEFERIGGEVAWRASSPPSGSTASATRTARRRSARSWRTPAPWPILALDGDALLAGSPAARGGRRADLLELPGRASSTRGRTPLATAKRELAEEIGKGARALGAREDASTPRPGSRTRSATSTWPRTSTTRSAEPGENERIEIVRWPLDRLDDAIAECRDSKTLIGAALAAARRA